MSEVTYGFVDANNVLIEFAVVESGDTKMIARLTELFNASGAYQMNLERETTAIGSTFWNGTRFVHESPFPSWVWVDEENKWQAPVKFPEDGGYYEWSEEQVNWVEATPPDNSQEDTNA